jgi:hypothetical protein
MLLPSILSLLSAAVLTTAARLTINIPPNSPALPNPATLPASTHATLLGAPGIKFTAPLRRDNTFVFDSLPESSYLLAIHSRDHFFQPYRVDVGHAEGTEAGSKSAQEIVHVWQTFRGNEWSNKGPILGSAQGELRVDIRPAAQKDFYQSRGGFSVMSIFKNPMILMGLVSVAMIFGMPKLMENSTFSCWKRSRHNAWFGCGFTDYCAQWMTRRRRKWKTSSRARLAVLRVLLRRFRTSTWLVSCRGSLVVTKLERRRRSECVYIETNRVMYLQEIGTPTLVLEDTLSLSISALDHKATCTDCLWKAFAPSRTSLASTTALGTLSCR